MTDLRWLIGGVVAGILAIDGLFAWFTYPDLSSDDLNMGAKTWTLRQSKPVEPISIEQLLAGGFWGDVPRPPSTDGPVNDQQKAATEAKKLRQKVSGIIKDGSQWQVLFKTTQDYRRFSIGEQLPGTDWMLKGVEADRLTLQQKGQKARVLKLFSADALVLAVEEPSANEEPSAVKQEMPAEKETPLEQKTPVPEAAGPEISVPPMPEASALEPRVPDGVPVAADKADSSKTNPVKLNQSEQ